MIDEKKLVEDVKRRDYIGKALAEIFETIIDEQPKVGEWIPCSEQLPEESLRSVIGWDAYRDRCVFVQRYGGRWVLGDNEAVKVIAWMPLPEPYREDGESDG